MNMVFDALSWKEEYQRESSFETTWIFHAMLVTKNDFEHKKKKVMWKNVSHNYFVELQIEGRWKASPS